MGCVKLITPPPTDATLPNAFAAPNPRFFPFDDGDGPPPSLFPPPPPPPPPTEPASAVGVAAAGGGVDAADAFGNTAPGARTGADAPVPAA